jgi:hypothetical protein
LGRPNNSNARKQTSSQTGSNAKQQDKIFNNTMKKGDLY